MEINIFKFDLNEKLNQSKKRVIALGKFQSFHKGHQAIFLEAQKIAKQENKELIIMLYPDVDGFNNSIVKSFITLETRVKLLKQYNTDHIMIFEKNAKNYNVDSITFINFLKNNLNVDTVVVGENFGFGKGKNDNGIQLLNENLNCKIVPLLKYNNQIISTHLINTMLSYGEVEDIYKLTNFNYFLNSIVIHGEHRGRNLGTPTINLKISKYKLLPMEGVYFSFTFYNKKRYNSITSISNNPTFKNKEISFETYIFNFDEEIYRKEVKVELLNFLRKPEKFKNLKELITQIEKDKEKAKIFFKKQNEK